MTVPAEEWPLTTALDTETALIAKGLLAPPLVCVSMASYDAPSGDPLLYHQSDPNLEEVLYDSLSGEVNEQLVGQNIAYDMGVLCARFPDLIPVVFDAYENDRITDTMLRDKLQHIAIGTYRGYFDQEGEWVEFKYSLEALALRRLGRQLDKNTWRLRYGELINVPVWQWDPGARKYAEDDAVATLDVWRDQQAEGLELLDDQYRRARAAWWQHLTSAWGLRTDAAMVKRYKERVEGEINALRRELQQVGLVRADGSRNTVAASKKMIAACVARGREVTMTEPTERNPEGKVSLDRAVCKALGDPLLLKYSTFSSLGKKLSTNLPLLLSGVDTPICPRYDLLETGRTSTSPNVQNVDRRGGFRECFVPRPGNVFASADYSLFELRAVAQVCLNLFGKSRLAEVLNDNFDPHLEMARMILGISYEEALRRRATKDSAVDDARQSGKVADFGFPGGLGAKRFCDFALAQYDVVVTEEQAIELKRVWLESWPEFDDYFQYVGRICDSPTPQITQHYTNRRRGNLTFTEACNSFFQGLAADAACAAGFLIAKACYVECTSPLFGFRIANMIHDEFIVEGPEARAPEAAEELSRLMRVGAEPFMPDVPPVAEPLLMRRWIKDAKALRGSDGRLVPYDLEEAA